MASSDAAPREGGDATGDAPAADGVADSGASGADAGPGDGASGAPCTGSDQCTGGLCLGGDFAGGYCSSPVAECNPGGGACGDGGLCTKSGGVDVDGAAVQEFCLVACTGPGQCRAGYSCCYGSTYASMMGVTVCVPPSLCPDQ